MRNLTRREVLKAGSTAAVTAMLNPLLGNAEGEKEGNNVRSPSRYRHRPKKSAS